MTPAQRMPAEWEPHAATWLAWPHSDETWPGCLERAQDEFELLVRALLESETVHLLVQSEALEAEVRKRLGDAARAPALHLHRVETDDVWLRDIGPTFVLRGRELVALDWRFNAWGGKYPPWERDDAVAARVAALAGTPVVRPGLTVEGGGLEVDGAGTLLANERTLLDPRRNPGIGRDQLERRLGDQLGVGRVIWVDAELAGDDTDGHIDVIARFSAPGRVLCAVASDPADENREPLARARAALAAARDVRGRILEVVDLPLPPPLVDDGQRLPASYANFFIAERAVLVPVFGALTDDDALARIAHAFPDRLVRPIPSRALLRGLGAVHCLTQQQPAVPA